jgi:hypothetical protein
MHGPPRTAHVCSTNTNFSSEADQLLMPASSLVPLSALVQPTKDKPNEIYMIWGTTVNLADTMKAFREFIKGFKPKYHGRHDCVLGLPTKAVPSPAAVEVLLYEGYLRSSAGLFFVFCFLFSLLTPSFTVQLPRSLTTLSANGCAAVLSLQAYHGPTTDHDNNAMMAMTCSDNDATTVTATIVQSPLHGLSHDAPLPRACCPWRAHLPRHPCACCAARPDSRGWSSITLARAEVPQYGHYHWRGQRE